LAGAEDQSPSMNTDDMIKLIKDVGRQPIERDSIYNILKEY
jgi:aminodeoxyfutalosine synthase